MELFKRTECITVLTQYVQLMHIIKPTQCPKVVISAKFHCCTSGNTNYREQIAEEVSEFEKKRSYQLILFSFMTTHHRNRVTLLEGIFPVYVFLCFPLGFCNLWPLSYLFSINTTEWPNDWTKWFCRNSVVGLQEWLQLGEKQTLYFLCDGE